MATIRKHWTTIIVFCVLVNPLLLLSWDSSSSSSCLASAAPTLTKTAASNDSGNENLFHDLLESRRKHVSRTLKSWRIRRGATEKITRSRLISSTTISSKKNHRQRTRGFMFTFQKPTKQRITQWFGIDEDSNEVQLGMLQKGFNHDMVGMTNPYLRHIQSSSNSGATATTNKDVDRAIPVSTKTTTKPRSSSSSSSSCWWPSIINPPSDDQSKKNKKKKKPKWRVLTYRDNVGNGIDCYNRVKEAILDWEFQNSEQSTGLMNVPKRRIPIQQQQQSMMSPQARYLSQRRYSVSPDNTADTNDNNGNDNDGGGSSTAPFHRTIGSARRMVSYASSRLFPFLPPIYAINPVMVVYDLVDQRGPGTTFTSTAYATMKGHLLKGEERVTVALRDNYDQSVDVEIISISRPSDTPLAKGLLWPLFIGRKQNKFFELQMDFLRGVGGRTSTTHNNNNNSVGFLKGIDGKQHSTGNDANNNKNREDNTKGKLPSKFLMKRFDDDPSHFESNTRLGEDLDF